MGKPYVYGRADDLGIPVIDAKARTFVAVTADDVIRAKKADSKHCALARAALRLPGVNGAYFFRTKAFLEYADKMIKYHLPESAQREIVSFDRAQILAPGVYQLSPIPPALTREGRHAPRRKRSKRPTPTAKGSERRALKVAIAKVAADEAKRPETAEEKQFEREMARIEAVTNPGKRKVERHKMTSGAVKKSAPMPLHPGGSTRFHRRSQYVRDLNEPSE